MSLVLFPGILGLFLFVFWPTSGFSSASFAFWAFAEPELSPRSSSSTFSFFGPPPNMEKTFSATPDAAEVTVVAAEEAAFAACSVKVYGILSAQRILRIRVNNMPIGFERTGPVLVASFDSALGSSPWRGLVSVSTLGSEVVSAILLNVARCNIKSIFRKEWKPIDRRMLELIWWSSMCCC